MVMTAEEVKTDRQQAEGLVARAGTYMRANFELRGSGSGHIPSMEGMRGLAMLLVFWAHYFILGSAWRNESVFAVAGDVVASFGPPAVSLFFLISGFGIYGILIRRPFTIGTFLSRRLQRIYPPFLVVLTGYVLASFIFPAESKLPPDTLAAIVYIGQNVLLLPGLFDITPIISVAWTLSYEMAFYIAVPILVAAFALPTWRRRSRVLFLSVLAVVLFAYNGLTNGPADMAMFLSGMLLYETIGVFRLERPGLVGTLALIVGFGGAYLIEPRYVASVPRTALVFVAFYVVCFSAFSNTGAFSRALSWSPLRWLGNMSYSYYLLHGALLKGLFLLVELVSPPQGGGADTGLFWALLPLAMLITLVGSAVLYLTVEKPASLARHPSFASSRARAGRAGLGSTAVAPGSQKVL
jgi:exopolysaccharide production protein ExoZ